MDSNLIQLRKISDKRGDLTSIESLKDLSFEIKRVYYIYNVPYGQSRGAHAHKRLEQLMIAMSGSFDIKIVSSLGKKTFTLNEPDWALYIPKMVWREMYNFSSDAVCLVLASDHYDENDYIRDYNEFLNLSGALNDSR